jgi:hypothetical protein
VKRMAPDKASSQLFTLRVWREDVGSGCWETRGRLQHVLTGETYYFRDWATLTRLVESYALPGKAPPALRNIPAP